MLDIYPRGDVHFIVIGINNVQSETSAALTEKGQIDAGQCIVGDLNLHWLSISQLNYKTVPGAKLTSTDF